MKIIRKKLACNEIPSHEPSEFSDSNKRDKNHEGDDKVKFDEKPRVDGTIRVRAMNKLNERSESNESEQNRRKA
jgi:hypothetical protein